jgi:hypothetical protein
VKDENERNREKERERIRQKLREIKWEGERNKSVRDGVRWKMREMYKLRMREINK